MLKPSIHFSKNFNQKLDCEFFTTIRPAREIYQVGILCDIFLDKVFYKSVNIMAIKLVNLSDLDDWTSYLDAGIPKNELIQLLEQYYPTIEREHFCILLLKSSGL